MLKNKNWKWIIYLALFLLGFISTYHNNQRKTLVDEKTPSIPSTIQLVGKRTSSLNQKALNDYTVFIKKISEARIDTEFKALFKEAKNDLENEDAFFDIPAHSKMYMLMQRWGEIAPLQAMDHINRMDGNKSWVEPLFHSWATRDPEKAVEYFQSNIDNPIIKNNHQLIRYMVSAWGQFDPLKTWDWLQNQQGKTLSGRTFYTVQDSLLTSIMSDHPKMVPQFLIKMDTSDLNRNAYNLGMHFAHDSVQFNTFMNQLPIEDRYKAEAGRLMSITDGNFDAIKKKINQFDSNTQVEVIKELSGELLNRNNLDTQERVEWILNALPVESVFEASIYIEKWIWDDRENAQRWIENLPPSKNKQRLLDVFNGKPLWQK